MHESIEAVAEPATLSEQNDPGGVPIMLTGAPGAADQGDDETNDIHQIASSVAELFVIEGISDRILINRKPDLSEYSVAGMHRIRRYITSVRRFITDDLTNGVRVAGP
jgi:hypothetical protein